MNKATKIASRSEYPNKVKRNVNRLVHVWCFFRPLGPSKAYIFSRNYFWPYTVSTREGTRQGTNC